MSRKVFFTRATSRAVDLDLGAVRQRGEDEVLVRIRRADATVAGGIARDVRRSVHREPAFEVHRPVHLAERRDADAVDTPLDLEGAARRRRDTGAALGAVVALLAAAGDVD